MQQRDDEKDPSGLDDLVRGKQDELTKCNDKIDNWLSENYRIEQVAKLEVKREKLHRELCILKGARTTIKEQGERLEKLQQLELPLGIDKPRVCHCGNDVNGHPDTIGHWSTNGAGQPAIPVTVGAADVRPARGRRSDKRDAVEVSRAGN